MPKGQRFCESCETYTNGVRSTHCFNCKREFAKKVKQVVDGVGKGKKKCTRCNSVNGARTSKCKNCGYDFKINQEFKTNCNWKELNEGDYIKVFSGSGPYYVNSDGERDYMGYKGYFVVKQVLDEGLLVRKVKLKKIHGRNTPISSSVAFIYMGETRRSDVLDSITKSKHNIRKVKVRV